MGNCVEMNGSGKLSRIKKRIDKGDYAYLIRRVFPGGNPVFYCGRQLITRLSDIDRFEEICARANKRCNYDILMLDEGSRDKLITTFPHQKEKFERRIRQGVPCVLAKKDDEIIGYMWFKEPQGDSFLTNSMWLFRPGKMDGLWGFDIFVDPAYRMRGLFTYILYAVYEEARRRGYETLYGEVFYTNEISIKSQMRIGYEIVKEVRYYSVLGLKIYVVEDPETGSRNIDFRYALNAKKYKL